jgi:uncharacterized protein with von Willebrand factor type A (vWA) domain
MASSNLQTTSDEWVSFPGGELEGRRPKALCPACRQALRHAATAALTPRTSRRTPRPLCFACYRAELDRQKAIAAAGQLDTASDARFQYQLPFEPIDQPRLEMLKADRQATRAAAQATRAGRFVDQRRQAQIDARHALQQIAAGLKARTVAKAERDRAMSTAFHAAELQLPDSWIPFVMSR